MGIMNLDLPSFKRVMRGYDPEEVEHAWSEIQRFVSELNANHKELKLQVNSLREQNQEWENRLKSYQSIEKDLRDALLSAQRIANQVEEEAQHKADTLLATAQDEATRIMDEAKQWADNKTAEVDDLLTKRQTEIAELQQEYNELIGLKTNLAKQIEESIIHLKAIKELLFSEND